MFDLLAAPPPSLDGDAPAGGFAGLWLELIGHLHPALVHFPIALLVTAAVVEFAALASGLFRRDAAARPTAAGLVCVWFGALGGAAAAFSGWTLAERERFGSSVAELLELHRWAGVTTAGLGLAALLAAQFARGGSRGALRLYRALLFLGAGAAGFAGHHGGSLVHGEEYLEEPFFELVEGLRSGNWEPAAATPAAPVTPTLGTELPTSELPTADLPLAAAVPVEGQENLAVAARALFAQRCVECHGPRKQKGSLRLDSREEQVEKRFVVIPGAPESSPVIERVLLPVEDEDHMPPEGPPLTELEVELLREWIAAGAPWPADGLPADG
jgi:uncharacterized membrane protein